MLKLRCTRSKDVVVHLKSMFSRHRICEFLKNENGPHFSGSQFKAFAAEYGSVHITSSPKFPQSNGEAERTVQTVKIPAYKGIRPISCIAGL